MGENSHNRRTFVKNSAFILGGALLAPGFRFNINTARERLSDVVLGHGDFRYRPQIGWGDLDPAVNPVNNCHEMVMDSRGRLIMVTDVPRNQVIIYNESGKLLSTWGAEFPGAHGLTLWNAGGEEFLFITDIRQNRVTKTTLDGRILMTLPDPRTIGVYGEKDLYRPTETAVGPNGDIYVADGYGSSWVLQFDRNGEFIRKFGGKGDADEQLQTAHGVTVDARGPGTPTLLVTSRVHNAFKRFTLDGKYISTVFLPGAFVCRAVINREHIYAGVCWSRLRYLNQTPNSGFVTILDGENRVVSNPGGTAPEYRDGELQLMVQETPIFKHCHDVCVDADENLVICQWNADKTYPVKLHRVS
jgi:hypothetical protein